MDARKLEMGDDMKREKIYVEQRRKEVLALLKKNPGIRIPELAQRMKVSVVTIRRDLQTLEDEKKISRFYGGAAVSEEPADEENELLLYRRRIAEYAASLVEDGDSLFINTSSTALQMIRYIKARNVTVITNNGGAIGMDRGYGVHVILTGGELRYPKAAMVGDFALRNLQNVFARKTFVGCSGISVKAGMTTENANEVNVNQLMIEQASQEVYILADHTKLGYCSAFTSCEIQKIHHLITDEKAPENVLEEFRKVGVQIHLVGRQQGEWK